MIGRTNARRGARRIFNVMQNRRLNQHIIYSVIDEVRIHLRVHAGYLFRLLAGLFCFVPRRISVSICTTMLTLYEIYVKPMCTDVFVSFTEATAARGHAV